MHLIALPIFIAKADKIRLHLEGHEMLSNAVRINEEKQRIFKRRDFNQQISP